LYGVVDAVVWFASLCTILVLGFLHCLLLLRAGSWLDYFGRNLSKKGWLGFSPSLGFSRDKLLCLVSCACLYCSYFSVHDIIVNGKEDLRTLVNLLL
jgi:hypothetical protein